MPAYHRGGGQQDVGEQRRDCRAQRRALLPGHTPGAGAGRDGLRDARGPGGAQLHPEGTGLQRIAGRHQRVGACHQAGHARRHGDLLTHPRCGESFLAAGGECPGASRHDCIHRVARRTEFIARIGVGQRRAQHVDRAAAPGHEGRTSQLTTAGHVQQCPRRHLDLVGLQGHPHRGDAGRRQRTHAARADPPVDTIDGATIGQRQAGTAGGGNAAREQFHPAADGSVLDQAAQLQRAHRHLYVAALLHRGGHQAKRAPRRFRRRLRTRTDAVDAQHGIWISPVISGLHGLRRSAGHQRAGRTRGGVQAGSGHIHRTGRHQRAGVAIAGNAVGQAHITAAFQRHVFEPGQPGDVADVDQLGLHRQRMLVRRRRGNIGRDQQVLARQLAPARLRQADVGRTQSQPRGRSGIHGHAQARSSLAVEAQALGQAQVDIAGGADVTEHGQATEAAGLQLLDRQRGVAIFQCGRQWLRRCVVLAEADRTRPQYLIAGATCMDAAAKGQAKRAAACAGTTGGRVHPAVQVQRIGRAQHDLPAVAVHAHTALAVDVQFGRRAPRLQARTAFDHHEGFRWTVVDECCALPVQRPTNLDASARAHLPAQAAAGIGQRNRVGIGIQQRAFGETPGAFGALPGVQRVFRSHIVDQDAAALGAQRAFNIDVACTKQRDRLPWIDRHQCIRADPQVTAHAVAVRTQADARACALADAPARRIGAVQRRIPRRQRARPISCHPSALGQLQARQGSDQLRAIGHLQALVAIDVVLRKATAEQAGVQSQRRARRVRIAHPNVATGSQREGTTALSSATEPAPLAQLHPSTAVGRNRAAVRLQADAAPFADAALAAQVQRGAGLHVNRCLGAHDHVMTVAQAQATAIRPCTAGVERHRQ